MENLEPILREPFETDTPSIMRKGKKKLAGEFEPIKAEVLEELSDKEKAPRTEFIHFEKIDFKRLKARELALLEKSLRVDHMTASELLDFQKEVRRYSSSLEEYKALKKKEDGYLKIDDPKISLEMHFINKVGNAILLKEAEGDWPFEEDDEKEVA